MIERLDNCWTNKRSGDGGLLLYVGSATDNTTTAHALGFRLGKYDAAPLKSDVGSLSLREALQSGYKIVKRAPLLQIRFPSREHVFMARAFVMGMESASAVIFAAYDSSADVPKGLYPWASAVTWTGLCTHDAMAEGWGSYEELDTQALKPTLRVLVTSAGKEWDKANMQKQKQTRSREVRSRAAKKSTTTTAASTGSLNRNAKGRRNYAIKSAVLEALAPKKLAILLERERIAAKQARKARNRSQG